MRQISKILLEKKAVTLNAAEPYTYVSGIRSPIYCDNRQLTSHPIERKVVVDQFVQIIKKYEPEVIAGTATSGIPWAAWVAAELHKPMVYIRKKGKGYGKDKLVEGGSVSGKSVVVVEDLVSTGGSSMNAVEVCREAGANVLLMAAIFTYEFEKAKKLFSDNACIVEYLTNFSTLVDVAAEEGYLDEEKISLVKEWRQDPKGWGPKHGFALAKPKN